MKKVTAIFAVLVFLSPYAEAYQEDASTKFRVGWSKCRGGDFQGAIDELTGVIKRDAGHVEAYYWRGKAYAATEDYKSALADFDKVIALNPDFASAYVRRAEVKEKLSDSNGAVADVKKAGDKDEVYKVLVPPVSEKQTEAIGLPEVANKGDKIGKALEKVTQRLKAKEPVSSDTVEKIQFACKMLREAFKEAKDDKKVDTLAGQILEGSEKLEPQAKLEPGLADQLCKGLKALAGGVGGVCRKDGKTAKQWYEEGVKQKKWGSYSSAITSFNKAIDLDPKMIEAFVERGDTYRLKRDYDKANADFEEAISLDEKCYLAYAGRGKVHFAKGQIHENNGISNQSIEEYQAAGEEYQATLGDFGKAHGLCPKDKKQKLEEELKPMYEHIKWFLDRCDQAEKAWENYKPPKGNWDHQGNQNHKGDGNHPGKHHGE